MRKLLALTILYSSYLFAQIHLESEDAAGGKYVLSFRNEGYQYPELKKTAGDAVTRTQSADMLDDSSIPSRELYIALPPNATPPLKFIPVSQRSVEGISQEIKDQLTAVHYRLKGYVWVDHYYCAVISIMPLVRNGNQIDEIVSFKIEFDLKEIPEINPSASLSRAGRTIIDNPKYGSLWGEGMRKMKASETAPWFNFSDDYIKLGVAADGIYRIRYDDLLSYGVPAGSLNPQNVKMYLRGKEIPIYVSTAVQNTFGQNDYIEFYGRRNYGDRRYREIAPYDSSYYEYLDRYSDTTMYWLTWGGGIGMRVDTALSVPATTDTLRYFDQLMHYERNLYWDYSLTGGDIRKNYPENLENETWNEGNLNVGKVSITFSVSNLFPGKPARAFAKLQDISSNISTNAHNLALSINNTSTRYDSGYINKYQGKVLKANFTSAALKSGNNTVDVISFTVPGNTVNTVIRDWYELEYPRYLKTTADSLCFAYNNLPSPMIADIRVSGLSPAIYSLYRYDSNDNTFQKITNFQFLSDTLHFADSVKNGISYCLLREDKIPAPVFFYKRKFINLRDAARQADYIAITHPYFLSAAQSYASFIASSYGITATVVNINDIYDEFNDGFFSPEPIRTFLKTAYEKWQDPKPKYAFLIGKATYDFYGNKSKYFGAPKIMNFVPSYGNPVSDNWFVMWDLPVSFVPQMNIGRLPVQTIDEFQSYFVKHQKYLSKGFDDWNKRYLFFAGGNFTDPSQIADAKGVNDYIINNYINSHPIGGNFANFYKTTNPVTNFGPYSPDYIQDAIDRGGVFISYIGHSGTQTWDNSITDMSQLKNTHDRSPLITDFGCSTGKFAEPDVVSFSELAVSEANGQAIGYIGNSSLGFTSTALGNGNPLNSFPKYFYKKLLIDTSASIGDVHRLARIDYLKQFGSSGAYGLFAKTNSLIGDPIVRLPIPTKPNYSIANSVMEISPENPTDQTESIGIALHYFNYGTVAGDSVTITIQDDYQGVTVFASTLRKKIPFYTDSVGISLPVKNKPGEHTITVSLDPENEIDEIYENDNVVVKKLLVAATTLRNLTGYQTLNQTDGKIVYLNPSAPSSNPQFLIDVSEQESFAQKQTFQVPFDTFYTQFTFENTYSGKRVWMRTRLNDISGEGITNSYVIGNKINYSIRDSASFQKVGKSVLAYRNDRLVLDSSRITFSVISAGQNDGNTAVITKNGQNYIPENTLRGYHVALFNKTSFEFVKYYWFEVIASSTIAASFAAFLDTLPPNYLVAISVSDEGSTNLTAQLKSSIKNYGSKFIDSVKFRYSWGMIGWKGALPGSVPEKFTKTFEGRVQIDTTITLPDTIGTFETPQFSSVAKWKDLKIGYTSVKPGDISLSVIGIKKNSESDTVKSVAVNDSIVTLTDIDANVYPSVKLAGTMHRSPGDQSPSVSSLEINYDPLPEIGTNYQAVQAYLSENGIRGKQIQPGDTVQQGEKVELVMKVYNASRIDVKHVKVLANAVWDNNSTESIISTTIDSIGALSKKELSALYNTSLGFGKRNFYITVDPDSALAEAYKDNNVYSFPFVVAKSSSHTLLPNLTITQNDIRLLTNPVTEQTDSAKVVLRYENTGALIGDSITISVRHFFQGVNIDTWTIRRKYPVSADTISLSLPINKQAGEHQLQVELDPVGLVLESSESDNLVNFYFKVVTTDFTVMQPTAFSTSAFSRIIWLNPTDIQSPEKSSAEIQLDTTESIASAVVTVPMNEFTTTYDIGSLKKLRRYYWRIRVQNSGREWTTGSFFLGDSSSFSLGQVDSASWALNTFVHSAYLPNSGAQIVDTRFAIHAASAGFSDGKSGAVTLNGTNLLAPIYGAGHNIVVIDTSNYSVVTARRFDVSNDPAETDSLIQFIASVLSGRMVVDVIVDDGANNLNAAARNALKTIGSSEIDNVGFRDSWGIIGRKGAASGTVPEQYKQQSSGSVAIDTLIIRKEYAGSIETAEFGPVTDISQFSIAGSVPAGTTLKATLFGRSGTTTDSIPLSGYITPLAKRAAAVYYPSAAIRFDLSTTNQSTPVVQRWSLAASPVKELALSEQTSTIDHPSVIEGEPITLSSTIYNVGGFAADSVTVQIKANDGIIDRVLQTEMLAVLSANDSAKISYVYDTRNRRGDHVFTVQIDPLHTFNEQTTANNAMTIPFTVIGDTLRPDIHVTVDGIQIVNGDYVSSHPEIFIQYKDNNPSGLLPSDTSIFSLKLNNERAAFTPGSAELQISGTPGEARIRWTPDLPDGENIIQISADDISGNASDTTTLFVNVSSKLQILDLYNIPNPFAGSTRFTFKLTGSSNADELSIKIYTVAGRLIHEIKAYGKVGFNSIYWDGRDSDGDEIGNGVYLYRLMVKQNETQIGATSKLVKMK